MERRHPACVCLRVSDKRQIQVERFLLDLNFFRVICVQRFARTLAGRMLALRFALLGKVVINGFRYRFAIRSPALRKLRNRRNDREAILPDG